MSRVGWEGVYEGIVMLQDSEGREQTVGHARTLWPCKTADDRSIVALEYFGKGGKGERVNSG